MLAIGAVSPHMAAPVWLAEGAILAPHVDSHTELSTADSISMLSTMELSTNSSIPIPPIPMSKGGQTFLSAGNPDAADVFIFLPTAFDVASVFYKLFNGWTPNFYAVAPDMPGGYVEPPIECKSQSPTAPATSILDLCATSFEEKMRWVRTTAVKLVGRSGKINFVAHGFGGLTAQEYHRRGYQPPIGKLVLISSPSDYLWSSMGREACNHSILQAPAGSSANSKAAIVYSTGGTWPNIGPPIVEEPYKAWVGSATFMASFWNLPFYRAYACSLSSGWRISSHVEEVGTYFQHANTKNAVLLPPLPSTLMLFGQDAQNTSVLAWPSAQAVAQPACAAAPWCTFEQVPIPAFTAAEAIDGRDVLYGNWLHLDNPLAVRASIESWVDAMESNTTIGRQQGMLGPLIAASFAVACVSGLAGFLILRKSISAKGARMGFQHMALLPSLAVPLPPLC